MGREHISSSRNEHTAQVWPLRGLYSLVNCGWLWDEHMTPTGKTSNSCEFYWHFQEKSALFSPGLPNWKLLVAVLPLWGESLPEILIISFEAPGSSLAWSWNPWMSWLYKPTKLSLFIKSVWAGFLSLTKWIAHTGLVLNGFPPLVTNPW